jgi:hypothetical protein
MTLAKVSVTLLAVLLVVVAVCPMQAISAQPDEFYAGQKGEFGSIGTTVALIQGGFHPYFGPNTWQRCADRLRADGMRQVTGRPW